MTGSNSTRWPRNLAGPFSLACAIAALVYFGRYGNPFPYTDDWGQIAVATGSSPLSLDWLLEQHGDHRIPLNKLWHVGLLRLSDFDFRIVVMGNVLVAALVSLLVLRVLRAARGREHPGDFVVPLLLLNPGFNVFHWGFAFQLESSTLLLIAFACCFIAREPSPRARALGGAALVALLLALCGLNGAVPALILTGGTFLLVAWTRPIGPQPRVVALCGFGLAFAVASGIFLTWSPTDASRTGGPAPGELAAAAGNLATILWPRPNRDITPDVLSLVLYLAIYLLATFELVRAGSKSLGERDPRGLESAALLLSAFACLATLASIAFGRGEGWGRGSLLHYGYLASPLVVIAWLAIARHASRLRVTAAATLLLLLTGASFAANWKRCLDDRAAKRERTDRIESALLAGPSIDAFLDRHLRDVFFTDGERARARVRAGLQQLMDAGVEPYASLGSGKD